MSNQVARWCCEYAFVFTSLAVLKNVFFPFMLWLWFVPGDLTAALQEATFLIFSVISIILLLSLGSISRHRYGLAIWHVTLATFLLNVPFIVLGMFPATQVWAEGWWSVIGDGIELWVPAFSSVKGWLLLPISLFLVLVGRRFYVRDEKQTAKPSPSKLT